MKTLLICDCDEVLLHMVRHFGVWLREHHDISFDMADGDFANAMRRADGGSVAREEMWGLLGGFFPDEMSRQTLVPHAREALAALAEHADIVILTNLGDHCRDARIAQLETHGIVHRVETNQGGKGDPVARLVAEYGSPVTVFVVVTSLIGSFQIFDTVAVTTAGGPVNSTKVLVWYIYENAFQFSRMGYATALSMTLFAILIVITLFQLRFFRSDESDLTGS